MLVVECDVCELLSASAVDLIGESGMIRFQFGPVSQDLMREPVQITNLARKPRHLVARKAGGERRW